MEQAARSTSDFLLSTLQEGPSGVILFLCGPGNNGADGVATARQLLGHPRWTPLVHLPFGSPAQGSLLELQVQAYRKLGGELSTAKGGACSLSPQGPLLWVDALFGIGLTRPIEGSLKEFLRAVSDTQTPVLAVDCPSGLDCDTGEVLGMALAATWTITFTAPKIGFARRAGPEVVGAVLVADLGVRAEIAQAWKRDGQRFQAS